MKSSTMKNIAALTIVTVFIAVPLFAGSRPLIVGDYVEARTAEVFTGGCIMGSEAETMGKEAVLAWRIDRGTFAGEALDGLSVVVALAGDRNLGIREIGGEAPAAVRAVVLVDERAGAGEREALVAFVRAATKGLAQRVVEVRPVPIRFERTGDAVRVTAGEATLDVQTRVEHNASCGAMQWFHPLATVTDAAVGMTRTQVYWGDALGTKWRQVDKKSAFVGTFSY